MFQDRIDAGLQLAGKLKKYQHDPCIVLAIPRGGVPVGYAVAKALGFPLEVVLTKKIGHPMNKEYAIGAASLGDYFTIPHEDVTPEYIEEEVANVQKRLQEMRSKFMANRKPENKEGKTLIVIDDGVATGNTLMATVNVLRKEHPGKIIIAVPVASQEAFQKLSRVADEVIALLIPDEFYGVGAFYEDFEQVSDETVIAYLNKFQV